MNEYSFNNTEKKINRTFTVAIIIWAIGAICSISLVGMIIWAIYHLVTKYC